MIRIPSDTKEYLVPNNSDLTGNIHYTKSVNFDEKGYIKLSPRAVRIQTSEVDTDFNIPLAFGRLATGIFYTVTAESPYIVQVDETLVTISKDTDGDGDAPPDLSFDSHGVWFQNLWHVTEDDELFTKAPSDGNWTDRNKSGDLTSGKVHKLEVFKNRNSICITNGNEVLQYDTNYSETVTLVIPAEYEANCLAYANNKMAVGTKLSDTASGQNGEAQIFIWNGSSTSASNGYPVGSDMVVGIVPYKNSFLALNRAGNFLLFNGGGFDIIGSLPHFYLDKSWGDSVNANALGDVMTVDGDVVYINLNNKMEPFGEKSEEVLVNAPAGVYCIDMEVGAYHRYSPSISSASFVTVTSANIDVATNTFTSSGGTLPATGNPVKYVYDKTQKIGGLITGRVYFIIRHSSNTFQLAETKEDAESGIAVNVTSTGAANNYFIALNMVDYGAIRTARTGGVALVERNNHAIDTMIFGGEYYDNNSVNDYEFINFLCKGFHNIGYIVTPKLLSESQTDIQQGGHIKYLPLKESETITIKYKTQDILGLPVTTPQSTAHCTWTDSNTFTTTADFSEAKAYLDQGDSFELECEIISGAGAGHISQIASITENAGTYTVNLVDAFSGASASDICDVKIENWKVSQVITSEDNDDCYSEFVVSETGTFGKYKVILSGENVIIYEFVVDNAAHKKNRYESKD